MNILVTGASGFIGSNLCKTFKSKKNYHLTACIRKRCNAPINPVVEIASIDSDTDWRETLKGQDVVVHTAARSTITEKEVVDPLSEYRKINVEGTLNLAQQASLAGVKRFIFVSSIKVNGEKTYIGKPFQPEDNPAPEDAYGITKLEAEAGLLKLAEESRMEVVIIRPPLVYGPQVKANFKSIITWVGKGIPLPLGSIKNKRSLIALDNLVDFILVCADKDHSPKAANQVFLISDGEDVSTTTLLRRVAWAYGVQVWLFPVPISLMNFTLKLINKKTVADRLFGNLQINPNKARELLGWEPVVTMNQQLIKMAQLDKYKKIHDTFS